MVRLGLKATHNVLVLKVVSLALKRFKDQYQSQTVLVGTDNSTLVAGINKQGGTHSVEMSALLWKIMTWCHHYQITLKSQAHFRMPQCDGLPFIQSNKQNGHCIRRCPNKSGKWFIPHVDLFAIHLNHKIPLFVAPVPDQHTWDIDAQNIICEARPK